MNNGLLIWNSILLLFSSCAAYGLWVKNVKLRRECQDKEKAARLRISELEGNEGEILAQRCELNRLVAIAQGKEGWFEIAYYYAKRATSPQPHGTNSQETFLRRLLGESESKASYLQQELTEFQDAFKEFAQTAWPQDSEGKKFGDMRAWILGHRVASESPASAAQPEKGVDA